MKFKPYSCRNFNLKPFFSVLPICPSNKWLLHYTLLLPFLQNLYVNFDIFHSLTHHCSIFICSPLPLSQSVLFPWQTTFPQCFCLCSLSMSHVFQCSVKLGPVKKVKLTQKSEKKLEHITVQKCSSTMSVSALYTIFVPLFPLSYSSNDCYLSFHYIFLPQAAKPEAEHYFPLFPHSTALQIFSLERSLQESVLDTLELSVSLPTSPCSTS